MTTEEINSRIKELEQLRKQTFNQLMMLDGGIAELRYQLERMTTKEPTKEKK